jgi:hypothetical protein
MADERVVIKIDTTYDGTGAKRALRDLNRLEANEKRLSSGQKRLKNTVAQSANAITGVTTKMRKAFDFLDQGVKITGNVLKKFVTTSLKLVTVEMLLLGTAMVGVHALFVTGRFLVKAYAGAMQVLAGGTAAAAVAIATAAAAIREQQAAMFAYRGKGAPELGSGLNQARVAMRALQMDYSLAGIGVENLNKAYAAMSKTMNTPQINASTTMFKSLMDFGSAGQDPGAAAEKVGAMIAALTDSKKSLSDVKTAAKELGPEMEKALKDANVKTKDELKKLIMSGELAKLGGVAGQFDAVNQTLIGQIKTFFNLVRGQFADFGTTFLEPAKVAMQKIFRILTRDINRMMVAVSAFGTGAFMDGLVSTVDRVSNWTVEMVQKWLPKAEGMWKRIANWWDSFTEGWGRMVDSMRPLIEGARVVEKAFSPIWQAIKQGGIDNLRVMREELVANEEKFVEFGNRIADLIGAVSEFFQNLKKALVDILPFINDMITGLTQVFKLLSSTMTKFAGSGFMGSLAPIMMMFLGGRQMSLTKGGFLGGMKTMSVNAQSVNIGGPGIGGPVASATANANNAAANANAAAARANSMGSGRGSGGQYVQTPSGLLVPAATGQTSNLNQAPITGNAYAGGARSRFGFMGGLTGPAYGRLGVADPYTAATRYDQFGNQVTAGRMAQARHFMRYQRTQSRAGAAVFGNEALGIRGFNNSMTARMGAGLGLSALSQVAPESMRGALALGGTVGMFNPMAGLAVAGLGGAMTGQGGGMGALSGAGGGAAMGMMVAGPAGAAVGAIIGGVGGAILGSVNKMRAQAKAAREAVDSSITSVLGGVATAQSMTVAQNRAILESGGSLAGKDAAFDPGQYRKSLDKLGSKVNPVAAMGKTDKTGWGKYMGAGAGVGATAGAWVGGVSGAVLGAGVGALPGAAIGAAAGAVVGMAGGAIIGAIDWLKGEIFNKDSQISKAQEQMLNDLYLNQKEYGIKISKTEYEEFLKDKDAAVERFASQINAQQLVGDKMGQIYNDRLSKLSEMSGKSAAEIEVLAQQLGVNLVDSTVAFMDVAKELGVVMARSAQQMKTAYQEAILDSTSDLEKEIEAKKASQAINEKARALKDKFDAGQLSELDAKEYIKQLPADILALYGGDPLAAYDAFTKGFGKGGVVYGEGKSLGGMEGVLEGIATPVGEKMRNNLITEATGQMIGALASADVTADRSEITAMFTNLAETDPDKFVKSLEFLQSGKTAGMFTGPNGLSQFLAAAQASGLKTKSLDIENLDEMVGELDELARSMGISAKDFITAVESFKTAGEEIFGPDGAGPKWFSEYPAWWGDTRTPRGDTTTSRLEQTMSRHAEMNSQLTGKRKVTSSYRNYALGSPSSDHVMGRAYDLTGQNLGAYSKLVHANGGFAEFHGVGGARHLHVVPGQGPVGDTSVPSNHRMPASVETGGSRGVVNNVTVNAAPGQSPDQIANAVMRKIEERARNSRERS